MSVVSHTIVGEPLTATRYVTIWGPLWSWATSDVETKLYAEGDV